MVDRVEQIAGKVKAMKRWLGPGMVAFGVFVFLIGVIGTFAGGDNAVAAGVTSTSNATTDSIAPSSSTTIPATTSTRPSTTTTVQATTSTAPATTTTRPDETVEEFLAAFSAALAAGDRDFVYTRLHPEITSNWGEDLCSAWVDREIMELSDYTFVSLVSGPADQVVSTPNGSATIADYFAASVSFVFQGETFFSDGGYALIDSDMYWLGQCR